MSLRENVQRFIEWSGRNKLKSFMVIVGSIYLITLPFVNRLPPTARERAVKREQS